MTRTAGAGACCGASCRLVRPPTQSFSLCESLGCFFPTPISFPLPSPARPPKKNSRPLPVLGALPLQPPRVMVARRLVLCKGHGHHLLSEL